MSRSGKFLHYLSAFCVVSAFTVSSALSQEGEFGTPTPIAPKKLSTQARSPQGVEKGRLRVLERSGAPSTSAPAQIATNNPTASPKNEVTRFQGWLVTCFDAAKLSTRSCVGKMNILKSNEDQRPILLITVNKTGNSSILILQTPTGIDLKAGVNLQIGKSSPHHLDYASCEPALCTAIVPLNDILANELGSFPTASASWTGLGVGEVRVEFALQEARNMLAFLGTR